MEFQGSALQRWLLLLTAVSAQAALAQNAVHIDGRLDEPQWAHAQIFRDFVLTQPLTGAPSPYPTEVRLLSTAEGLVFGFRNTQPPEIVRTRQRSRRDEGAAVDRINVLIDYDGSGRVGYNFTVSLSNSIMDEIVTSENQFRSDWDGLWEHAVTEDETAWYVEVRVPWSTGAMRSVEGSKRNIGLYFDRVIGSTGERMAWPNASFQRPVFLSDFTKVEVDQYRDSLLAITPYAVAGYDLADSQQQFKLGADIFWKPGGPQQLTATINPDFGQVESDDLVVNFSAIESFFSDKRPFFTENQSIFNINVPRNVQPIYTRRVGGPSDDSAEAAEIDAAVKLTGHTLGIDYGVMAASERGDGGSDFWAARAQHNQEDWSFGGLWTHVRRPFLNREADVLVVDPIWRPNSQWTLNARLMASAIDVDVETRDGLGATLTADYVPNDRWRHQLLLLRIDDTLDLNDFGFQDRNDYARWQWEGHRRDTDLAEDSRYSSHDWGAEIAAVRNGDGVALFEVYNLNRFSERRDGGTEFLWSEWLPPGYDDLISRGNGIVRREARFYGGLETFSPRREHWGWSQELTWSTDGARGPTDTLGLRYDFSPTFHASNDLNFPFRLGLWATPDWLLWEGGDRFASYRTRWLNVDAGVNWLIGDTQELRVKLQSITADLEPRDAWRIGDRGRLRASAEIYPDRAIRSLGFQVRYRYKLGPLSDFFIVYARGGFDVDERASGYGLGDQFADTLALDEDEQLLVKLSYRFDR